jgi:dihydrofolate reductase
MFLWNPQRKSKFEKRIFGQCSKLIKLIAIVDEDFGVSKNSRIPWSFSADLRFFYEKTRNQTVVMGRNTYFSIGATPLKDRINCIISANMKSQDNIKVFNSIENVMKKYSEFWIIGGAMLYNYALKNNLVDYAIITKVHKKFHADSFLNKLAFEKFVSKNTFSDKNYSIIEYSQLLR